MRIKPFILLILIISVLVQCRRDELKWETQNSIPVAKGSLNFRNLEKDGYVVQNSDQSLDFAYSYTFSSLKADSIFKIPDSSTTISVTLKKLTFAPPPVEERITLGELAAQSGDQGEFLIQNDGKKIPIAAINNISLGIQNINTSDLFETATFIEGNLVIRVSNQFPVDLEDLSFTIRNKSDKDIIAQDIVPLLPANSSRTRSYPLNGKTVEGELEFEVDNVSTPGSGGKSGLSDLDDAVIVRLNVTDIQLFSADAIFPAQDLVNDTLITEYNLDPMQIQTMRIKSGEVRITTTHTLPDSIYIIYRLPVATKNGSELIMEQVVPPSPNGDSVTISGKLDIAGYDMDFTQAGNIANSFNNFLIVSIDSTGIMVEIGLDDSLRVTYGLYNIIPDYARGFLGSDTVRIGPEHSDFDFFDIFQAGEFDFSQAEFRLTAVNGIGADSRLSIDQFSATNTRTNKNVVLQSNLNKSLNIERASSPDAPSYQSISFNEENSNANELLNIRPDIITYDINMIINPKGNTGSYSDFISDESEIEARAEIHIPLKLKAKNLKLTDTAKFSFPNTSELQDVKWAELSLISKNSLPVEARIQAYLLNDMNQVIDSLFDEEKLISPGELDASMRVVTPKESISKLNTNIDELNKFSEAEYIVIRGTFNTSPATEYVTFYDHYALDFNLVVDFKMETGL